MTDKQIIIDDLDTRCPYHCNERIGQCNNSSQETPHTYCINNKDCIYKIYARKEQECERLNEHSVGFARKCQNLELDVCHLKDKNYNLQRQLDQLKTENDELKRQLESTKGLVTVGNKQLAEALLELQKYEDNEQQEKEMQKLYNKFEGSSLIDCKNKRGVK